MKAVVCMFVWGKIEVVREGHRLVAKLFLHFLALEETRKLPSLVHFFAQHDSEDLS